MGVNQAVDLHQRRFRFRKITVAGNHSDIPAMNRYNLYVALSVIWLVAIAAVLILVV
jgi:hypothetical protein